jgi:hypothetical protein
MLHSDSTKSNISFNIFVSIYSQDNGYYSYIFGLLDHNNNKNIGLLDQFFVSRVRDIFLKSKLKVVCKKFLLITSIVLVL